MAISGQFSAKNYTTVNFNEESTDWQNNVFSLIHLNNTGANTNPGSIKLYLEGLQHNFSVIGVSEKRLDSLELEVKGQRYRSEHLRCDHREGGGLSLYVKAGLKYRRLNRLDEAKDDLECMFIEIYRSNFTSNCSVVLGIIHRPPKGSKDIFMEFYTRLSRKLDALQRTRLKRCIYLMGDFNSKANAEVFFVLENQHQLIRLVKCETKKKSKANMVFDAIFCSEQRNRMGTLDCQTWQLSDHCPVFAIDSNILNPVDETKR
ncbi:hypothetical protein CAPTEDRAFT_205841 [Capitella teleta]|uniref:Endonuclease/exonuclease/phosphatase domain-containing protein n=1 Tax=Capitella teleta TaxID=283909 RepID=R7TC35_CAPTE|nr:hypothetical protein CAPTEDRAFT_205841 [Capitella teleta]|eukprot:ELT91067.1 hypothetical protein CAPTEDRAFT_205841 [Capitella teleta]